MKQIFFLLLLSFAFAEKAFADLGHPDAQRTHAHCASGVILYGSAPDCGDDEPVSGGGAVGGSGDCQPGTAPGPGGLCIPTRDTTGTSDGLIVDSLGSVLQFLAGLIAAVAILMIVISGIMYITSAGDSGRVDRAKQMLLYAIIGLIIALLAWVIVAMIVGVFGDAPPGGSDCPPNAFLCAIFN